MTDDERLQLTEAAAANIGATLGDVWSMACGDDNCEHFDGKRCRRTGFRPGTACEPTLDEVFRLAVLP